MADTSITVTVTGQFPLTGDPIRPMSSIRFVTGTITFAAGDYVANGIAFKTALLAAIAAPKVGLSVVHCSITGIKGYHYHYVQSSGKVEIFYSDLDAGADGPDITFAVTALPAGVTSDVITFLAVLGEAA